MSFRGSLLAASLCLVCAVPTQAAWSLLEDFNALVPGDINGQASWVSANATGAIVAADPVNASNQVLHRVGNGGASRPLNVANGTTASFYLRVYRESATNDDVFGLSDVANPDLGGDFSVFEAQSGVNNTNLRMRDGGSVQNPAVLVQNVWYNVWLVVDNATDSSRLYLQSDSDPLYVGQTELLSTTAGDTDWDFRNGVASNALVAFLVKATNGPTSSVYYDDLYLDTAGANTLLPTSTLLLGDTDGNGKVEAADFNPIRDNFQKTVMNRSQGDLTGDLKVNFLDFRQWRTAFLAGGGSMADVDLGFFAGVPEPSTCGLSLILVSGFGLFAPRRRAI
jgi:hypothetical protein